MLSIGAYDQPNMPLKHAYGVKPGGEVLQIGAHICNSRKNSIGGEPVKKKICENEKKAQVLYFEK